MTDNNTTTIKNLAAVDSSIQKLLWIQLVAIIVYGLLFIDGLSIKRQTDALRIKVFQTEDLLARFSWLDSLFTISVKQPQLVQQYDNYLTQFNRGLSKLQQLTPNSTSYNVIFNHFNQLDSRWNEVRSEVLISYVSDMAQRGKLLLQPQIHLMELVKQPPPPDVIIRDSTFLQALQPLPSLMDSLRLIIKKINPRATALTETYYSFTDFLAKNNSSVELPSNETVVKAINDVKIFAHEQGFESDSLSVLRLHHQAFLDSIRIKEQQKGKLKFAVIEQPISVKLAFQFGLPLLIFFNHLFLLLISKKKYLHNHLSAKNIHLSPIFFNFLFMDNTPAYLKIITWCFFSTLEIGVLLLGLAIFWYTNKLLSVSSTMLLLFLVLLLIHSVQIILLYVKTIKIK